MNTETVWGKPIMQFPSINQSMFRKLWFETAKQCSVGVLLFGFTSKAWDYPQTLESVLHGNAKVRRRFDRWIKSKRTTFSNVLSGDELAYMLRK